MESVCHSPFTIFLIKEGVAVCCISANLDVFPKTLTIATCSPSVLLGCNTSFQFPQESSVFSQVLSGVFIPPQTGSHCHICAGVGWTIQDTFKKGIISISGSFRYLSLEGRIWSTSRYLPTIATGENAVKFELE